MRSNELRFDPSPRDAEMRDLSPSSFRFIVAMLIGLGVLGLAGIF